MQRTKRNGLGKKDWDGERHGLGYLLLLSTSSLPESSVLKIYIASVLASSF